MGERQSGDPQDYVGAARKEISQTRRGQALEPLLLEKLAEIGELAEAVARLDTKLKTVIQHAKERAIKPGVDELPDGEGVLTQIDRYLESISDPSDHVLSSDGQVHKRGTMESWVPKSEEGSGKHSEVLLREHQDRMVAALEQYLDEYIQMVEKNKKPA